VGTRQKPGGEKKDEAGKQQRVLRKRGKEKRWELRISLRNKGKRGGGRPGFLECAAFSKVYARQRWYRGKRTSKPVVKGVLCTGGGKKGEKGIGRKNGKDGNDPKVDSSELVDNFQSGLKGKQGRDKKKKLGEKWMLKKGGEGPVGANGERKGTRLKKLGVANSKGWGKKPSNKRTQEKVGGQLREEKYL